MRVAIYTRVSTNDQSCERQQRELFEYAKARQWEVVATFEEKMSGTKKDRPQLKALMALTRARKIDVVLVWKLDRFARSLKDLISMLQELTDLGVLFVSLHDQLDLTTASGRLMMQMIGAFAEFEVSLIKERVKSGLRNARAKGIRLGRPKKRNDQAIIKLRTLGYSIRQVAEKLSISPAAVQRALLSSTVCI